MNVARCLPKESAKAEGNVAPFPSRFKKVHQRSLPTKTTTFHLSLTGEIRRRLDCRGDDFSETTVINGGTLSTRESVTRRAVALPHVAMTAEDPLSFCVPLVSMVLVVHQRKNGMAILVVEASLIRQQLLICGKCRRGRSAGSGAKNASKESLPPKVSCTVRLRASISPCRPAWTSVCPLAQNSVARSTTSFGGLPVTLDRDRLPRLFGELDATRDHPEVSVDFEPLRFSMPTGMLALGSKLREWLAYRKQRNFPSYALGINDARQAHSYLMHLGFFHFIGLDAGRDVGETRGSRIAGPSW